jgi:hypothetical protein
VADVVGDEDAPCIPLTLTGTVRQAATAPSDDWKAQELAGSARVL